MVYVLHLVDLYLVAKKFSNNWMESAKKSLILFFLELEFQKGE